MRVAIHKIRPSHGPDFPAIERRIKERLDDYCVPRIRGYFEKVVSYWDDQPDFQATYTVTRRSIRVWIRPVGKFAQRWVWVSRGTEGPYRIPTVRKPNRKLLRFRTDYKPHTRPRGPSYSGPGVAVGPVVFAREVTHPGIRPRHFEEAVARWSRTWFAREMHKAVQKGVDDVWR